MSNKHTVHHVTYGTYGHRVHHVAPYETVVIRVHQSMLLCRGQSGTPAAALQKTHRSATSSSNRWRQMLVEAVLSLYVLNQSCGQKMSKCYQKEISRQIRGGSQRYVCKNSLLLVRIPAVMYMKTAFFLLIFFLREPPHSSVWGCYPHVGHGGLASTSRTGPAGDSGERVPGKKNDLLTFNT